MYEFRIGDGIDALYRNQIRRVTEGYGVRDGVSLGIGTSGTDIEIEVFTGEIQFPNQIIPIVNQTVIIEDGDSQPRKDVIYLAQDANAYVLRGDPAEPQPDGKIREQAGIPQPPDTAELEGVVIGVIWVPANATDSTDLEVADIEDRRFAAIIGLDEIEHFTKGFPLTSMEAGGSATLPIAIDPGETFVNNQWGITYVEEELGPFLEVPTGVQIQIIDAAGDVQESTSSKWTDGSSMIENEGASAQVLGFQIINGAGTDFSAPEGFQADIRYEIR